MHTQRLQGSIYTVLRQWPDGDVLTDGERSPLQLTWLRTVLDIASDPDTIRHVVQVIESDLHSGTCRDVTDVTMQAVAAARHAVPDDGMPAIRNGQC